MAGAFGAGAAAGAVAGAASRRGGVSEGVDETTADQTTEETTGQASPLQPTREEVRAGYADGKLDHLDLVNSNVANSQLAKGRMTAGDRKAMRGAAADERVAAKAFEKNRRAELGLAPLATTKRDRMKAAFADTWSSTQQQFREKPVRTSLKYAAIGAAVVTAAPTMAFAPIIAPLAVGAGALIGKTATRSIAANTRGAKRQMDDVRAENYRQAMRHQLKQKAPKQPKISRGGNGSENVSGSQGQGGGTPPTTPTQQEAPLPDTGAPGSGGQTAPVTAQLPVI